MILSIYFGSINRKLNATSPHLGNPGVGGTQYCMLLLAHYLKEYAPDIKVYILSESELVLETGLNYIKTSRDLVTETAKIIRTDILIVKNDSDVFFLKQLKEASLKIIIWGHNYYFADFARWVSETPNIKANVFVGKQQYDRYIDHEIIKKSVVIFNMLPDILGESIIRENDSKTVIYMGALVPVKGFLQLAQIWKGILKIVPDARLLVMGTGNLYNSDCRLGPLGVADEDFEKEFIPYISDESGMLLSSVKFLGIVKEEKYDFFKKASIGVVNPSARTETFGMGVIEMAIAKLPVVTLKKNGYPDTIKNKKSGYLCNSLNEIQNKIIYLLQHPEKNNQMGEVSKQMAQQFAPEIIIKQWISLLNKVYEGNENVSYSKPAPPYNNNFKWIRIINRFLRFKLHLKFVPPLINIETAVYNRFVHK